MQNEFTISGQQAKWLSGADELLAWLGRSTAQKNNGLLQSDALLLLKQAEKSLAAAQAKITAQENRIARLEAIATTDELTGIANRRGFFEQFYKELSRTERDLSTGGLLILIDLDNFKTINDTHGHQAGDAALNLVAQTLAADTRIMDTVARIGGDEFVLLLANTDRAKSAARARDLVGQLNALSLIWGGTEISVRASLGLREYTKGDTAERIFGDADAAMYESKLGNKLQRQETKAAIA